MADSPEKMVEINDHTDDELGQALVRAKDELFRLRLGRVTNQLSNPMQIRAKRREIARIKTVISARSRGAAQGKKQ
jgi:large subunit ribosomal protein L29